MANSRLDKLYGKDPLKELSEGSTTVTKDTPLSKGKKKPYKPNPPNGLADDEIVVNVGTDEDGNPLTHIMKKKDIPSVPLKK